MSTESGVRDPRVVVDADFGRAAPSLGWVPAPRYLLRRAMILDWLAAAKPGRILEVGAGAGTLLADLAPKGFSADAVETSPSAREMAAILLQDVPSVRVLESIPAGSPSYDYLFAFEVLEHIATAPEALASWVQRLRSGGRVLLSVPAYADRWTATDRWAGHVRRYDKADFIALAQSAGLRVLRCRHYGYPLADILEPINARRHQRLLATAASSAQGTAASGVQREAETRLYPLMTSWLGRRALRTAIAAQWNFATRGNGLLLEGTLP